MTALGDPPVLERIISKEGLLSQAWHEFFTNDKNRTNERANKVVGGIEGNFTNLDADGDLQDSGKSPEDIEELLNDHSERHEDGGDDEINVDGLSGVLAEGQTPASHDHDGDTLKCDEINSDGGAFAFTVSGVLTFTDSEATRTLKQLGCPTYKYIKATGQAEGDLHLSDGTNWAVSKALIKTIRIVTSSTDWDLYILQNDNGHAADDAAIPEMQLIDAASGNANIMLDLPFEDEDGSNEVHIYWISNSGVDTADIYILGYELL